jgi:hypothetical protein
MLTRRLSAGSSSEFNFEKSIDSFAIRDCPSDDRSTSVSSASLEKCLTLNENQAGPNSFETCEHLVQLWLRNRQLLAELAELRVKYERAHAFAVSRSGDSHPALGDALLSYVRAKREALLARLRASRLETLALLSELPADFSAATESRAADSGQRPVRSPHFQELRRNQSAAVV